jgi:hypothetical protein
MKEDDRDKLNIFFTSELLEDYAALAISALILILVLLLF